MFTTGLLQRKTYWAICEGNGRMHFLLMRDIDKEIEKFAKLRDKGSITTKQFNRVRDALLEQCRQDPHLDSKDDNE